MKVERRRPPPMAEINEEHVLIGRKFWLHIPNDESFWMIGTVEKVTHCEGTGVCAFNGDGVAVTFVSGSSHHL